MFNQNEFKEWIELTHRLMHIFEGRHDVYPHCRRWVEEWYANGSFVINKNDKSTINKFMDIFDYNVYRNMRDKFESDDSNWGKIRNTAESDFQALIHEHLNSGMCENIGLGLAPYLFTWNFQRFKKYIKVSIVHKKDFDLKSYFIELGQFIEKIKDDIKPFRAEKLVLTSLDEKRVNRIGSIFNAVNKKLGDLGIRNSEPVGTAKVLHIVTPYYFPLIDNPMAKTTGLKRWKRTLDVNDYIKWIKSIKLWLGKYDYRFINQIEKQFDVSILKLIDEGLYMMSSIELSLRVKKLGLIV